MNFPITIRLLGGQRDGDEIKFVGPNVLIGRSAGCEICFPRDNLVSRMHARIFFESGDWWISDAASTNGTYINGTRVTELALAVSNGDRIQVGSHTLEVSFETPPAPPTPKIDSVIEEVALLHQSFQRAPRPDGPDRERALQVYVAGMNAITRDGVINPSEVIDLWRVQFRLGLLDEDTLDARAQAFATIWDQMSAAGLDTVSAANSHLLYSLRLAGVGHPVVVAACRRAMATASRACIATGVLPEIDPSTMHILPGERCHFELEGSIVEERMVTTGWASGSQGLGIRIARGLYFRVGATRGHYIREKQMVRVSNGSLVLTSKRLAFLGAPKSLEAKWSKVLGVEAYSDGLQIFLSNRAKSPLVLFSDGEPGDVVGAICSHYLS